MKLLLKFLFDFKYRRLLVPSTFNLWIWIHDYIIMLSVQTKKTANYSTCLVGFLYLNDTVLICLQFQKILAPLACQNL
jgi:hypothetical protein